MTDEAKAEEYTKGVEKYRGLYVRYEDVRDAYLDGLEAGREEKQKEVDKLLDTLAMAQHTTCPCCGETI